MSITKKLTLVVLVLAALLLGVSGYLGVSPRARALLERAREQTKAFALIAKASAELALNDYGHLGAIEDAISRRTPLQATFYGHDGRAIAPVPTEEAPAVNPRARRVIERNKPEEDLWAGGYAYLVPLQQAGRVAGALEIRANLAAFIDHCWTRTALLSGASLLLVFSLVVGLFTRRAIGRPIEQLMDGMDHVIRGDLTHILPLDRADEIGRIAYRFNEMTAQLRDAQTEIRRNAGAKLQLEQRLRQSEKLATIGQLAAEIAHEVGTPLNVIGARARTLERKAEHPEEVRKNAAIIADQAVRITKVIRQMLDLSRARIPERTTVDIRRILADALAFLEHQIERSQVEVIDELPPELPPVIADADGMQQVFINLLLNAVQAMPGGGQLRISGRQERRRKEGLDLAAPQLHIAVEISDTGSGILPEQQSLIFEPFYSTKRRGEGTGLGLTVVHGIVKEHDGWIEVASALPQGTSFRVYLPAEEQTEELVSNKGDQP